MRSKYAIASDTFFPSLWQFVDVLPDKPYTFFIKPFFDISVTVEVFHDMCVRHQ